jgi:hypothetical protein
MSHRSFLGSIALLGLSACGSSSDSGSPCSGSSCAANTGTTPTVTAMPNQPSSNAMTSPVPNTSPSPTSSPEAQTPLPIAEQPGMMTPGAVPPAGLPVKADSPTLLNAVVKFYGAQRSGDGANWLLAAANAADPARGTSCHMNDGEAMMLDLSGGWYDAGDHVKVTLSIAYASYVMLKAFDAFPQAFPDRDSQRYTGAPNGVPDVLDEARYATDYLVKAHISDTQLVGMIGNAQNDHRMWVSCLDQEALPAMQGGRPRPVNLQANADIAGITAASLALMSRLYRPYDAALADTYQAHALSIYQIGKNNQRGSNPGLYGQTGTAWQDEMLAGAAELYRLTDDGAYLDDAKVFNDGVKAHGWAPNYSQSADFSRHTLYVAGAADAVADYWRLDDENY